MAYSLFENDYKTAINNILKNIYSDTDYWGKGHGSNYGIVKPITKDDDINWSNYNFINTHWTVRDDIILPLFGSPQIEKDKKYSDSEINTEFFKELWKRRLEIFGPDSKLANVIINTINRTRKSGDKRENFVKLVLDSIDGVSIDMVSQPGGTEDFQGIDIKINSNNNILPSGTAQIKPFKNITKDSENWYVNTDLRRAYTTDYLIFGKQSGQEYHLAVFTNKPELFKFLPDNQLIIPKKLIKLLINYNTITKNSNIKGY